MARTKSVERIADDPAPGWAEHAACLGQDTDLFFAEATGQPTDHSAARAICNTCQVRTDCLNYALNDPSLYNASSGIYGGTTFRQRVQIRRHTRERRAAS